MTNYIISPMFWLTFFLQISYTFTDHSFKKEIIDSGFFTNEVQIQYFVQSKNVGFVGYTKFPLVKFYVIHSLYIQPQHRNQGYGRNLLQHACQALQQLGATQIYIQPGPFEISESYMPNAEAKHRNIQKLVRFYESEGFKLVNWFTSFMANILYKIIGIDENSSYLMVKKL